MALNQVAARIEGDVYQSMFFWYQASSLLVEDKKTVRVILEHDAAMGVDDVSIYYDSPGIVDAGRYCYADFYQVKYHVDNSDSYSSDNLIDPSFIKGSISLLQRFHNVYLALRDTHPWFRLHLVSNWIWKPDDILAKGIREVDGSLPEKFFSSTSRSALGSIYKKWRSHLGIDKDTFEDFARRLRFGFNYFGRRPFEEALYDRLGRVGLKVPSADSRVSHYNSLYQQFVIDRTNDFTRQKLRELCRREGLLIEIASHKVTIPTIGIRSFMRFAERMEDETSSFICVAKHFDGRYILDSSLWADRVVLEVRGFLNNPLFRNGEHRLLLDCHSSLAFLAGYEFDQKSGVTVYPVQKGLHLDVWKPSGIAPLDEWKWKKEVIPRNSDSRDIAMAISVTHDICGDVENYLVSKKVPVKALVKLSPATEIGPSCITGADHAFRLAELAMQEIIHHRKNKNGVTHIFSAAPNGFLFFLGRYRAAMGKVKLYEFDFEGEQGGSYMHSFSLPL